MAKQITKTRYSRDDVRFWRDRVFRPRYTRSGSRHQVKEFSARIQHLGRRQTFPLGVSNKEAAADQAKRIYLTIVREGWTAALEKFKGRESKCLTIGEFLQEARRVSDTSERTFGDYARALREIAAGVHGISDPNNKRFAPKSRAEWLNRVHSLRLDSITPSSIQKWRLDYVRQRSGDPICQRSAQTSCDTRIRCARSLFSKKKVLNHLKGLHGIVDPFAEVNFFSSKNRRYHSKFDAEALLRDAQRDLMSPRSDSPPTNENSELKSEAFKALIIFAFTGLRRKELDLLVWDQVDLNQRWIDLCYTKYFSPKAESSIGRVPLDEDAVSVLRGFRARAENDEFVMKGEKPRPKASYSYYRANKTFKFLLSWLRSYQLADGSCPLEDVQKPLHELRKEVGAILTTRYGIYAAKTVLRHSDISTTASYYADQKTPVSVGIRLMDAPDQDSSSSEFVTII